MNGVEYRKVIPKVQHRLKLSLHSSAMEVRDALALVPDAARMTRFYQTRAEDGDVVLVFEENETEEGF